MKAALIAWLSVVCLDVLRFGAPSGFLVAGLAFAADRERGDWLRPWLIWLAIFSYLPPLAWWVAGELSGEIFSREVWAGKWHLSIWIASAIAGVAATLLFKRYGTQLLDRVKDKFTVSSSLERNKKTDVREIHRFLPVELPVFDPRKYFGKRPDGIFAGLDEKGKPVFIDYEAWKISHVLLTGRTRSGKGVAAQILLSQAIAKGEYVVILDPKIDSWMPHVFYDACRQAKVPYRFLDLRQSAGPQANLFAGCDEETIENMLVGGFSLSEKGEVADFYRLADRKAARQAARWLAGRQGGTVQDVLGAYGGQWADSAPGFLSYLQEMAELPAVCRTSPGGIDVAEGVSTGGCLYVIGDMINPRIIRMQRMILLRLLFLAKNRDHTQQNRTICVLADEAKVHLARPFMTSLAASAGWAIHSVICLQSFQDLADCPSDLDKDAVRGSVMENCGIQISYAIKDSETATWLAESTGTVLVDDESRKVSKNVALSETIDGDRTLRQTERHQFDTNMLMNMPKGCGLLSVVSVKPTFCCTSPVPVQRVAEAVKPTVSPEPARRNFDAGSALDLDDDK